MLTRGRRALVALLAVTAALAAPALAQAVSPPANDDFVRQQSVVTNEAGLPDGAFLAAATSEPGEPPHGSGGAVRSAWWSWTAPADGLAEVQSCSDAFTPLLALYTGFDVARLMAVPATVAPGRCQLKSFYHYGTALRFDAVKGITYRIATATDSPADGSASIAVQVQPAGDDFADPAAFAPADDRPYGTPQNLALGLAGVQPGEPAHGGRSATHSVWFAFASARGERVRISACKANYSAVSTTATIYRGSTLDALTEVASSRDAARCTGGSDQGSQVEAPLEAGVDYRIAVTQDDPTAEPLSVMLERSPRDDSARTPSKLSGGRAVDLALATREPGEPDHAGQAGGRSRWETFTPTQSATYEIATCGAPWYGVEPVPDALLAVYEGAPGTPASDLVPVASNDDGCPTGKGSLVRFPALAGHRYLVAIASKGDLPGTADVTVASSPTNDDRDAAARFDGRTFTPSTTLATAEPGEPAHAGSPAAHSLWYRWVAPRGGIARVQLCGPSFDAVVAVYGVDATQPALASSGAGTGCNDAGFGTTGMGPHFDVPVTAGRTYLVAIDGRNGATGTPGVLSMTVGAPLNDDLADATSLARAGDDDSISSVDDDDSSLEASADATAQAGEPAHAGRSAEHSSWWRWTSTRTGSVTVSACYTASSPETAAGDTTLAVYTGDDVTDLEPVAAADAGCGTTAPGNARLSFYAVEGTIYRVALDLHGATIRASMSLSLPPANDSFDRARDITPSLRGGGDLGAATREPGEPDHAGRPGGRSLWYTWTAARTGLVAMYTCGYLDTLLGVYTGTAVDDLREVTSDDDSGDCSGATNSELHFVAQAGTSYRIAVDGKDGATGMAYLNIRTAGPADSFASAAQLQPRPGSDNNVDLSLSSAEPGEPAHAGRAAVRSSWLRFTPTRTFVVEATSCSWKVDTRLAAYTGGDLATLTAVASDDDGGGCDGDAHGAKIRFRALAGVTYSLAVDAATPAFARVDFSLFAGNDDLRDAADLAPEPGTVLDDQLAGATREAGEAEHGAGPTAVSVWYRIHVTSARTVRVSVCPTPNRGSIAHLAAYTGDSIATLQPVAGSVASACPNGTVAGRLAFPAEPGADVLLAVSSAARDAHEYAIKVEVVPENDLFASATVLPDSGGGGYIAEAAHATREPGEPLHAGRAGGHSVWWSSTPTSDRVVKLSGCAAKDPLLAVYTGDSVDALTAVAIGEESGSPYYCASLSFDAHAGVTYHVAVDVDGGGPGQLQLILMPQLPDHASFAAAEPVRVPSSTYGELQGPGPEPGEPVHGGLGRTQSVWYQLDAVRDETVDINSCGFNGADTVVAVYTGTAVDALTEVASNDEDEDAACTFGVQDAHVAVALRAGTTYWIAVDNAIGSSDMFELLVTARAPHDAFADPFELAPGVPVSAFTGTASAEPGEPAHDGLHASRSVWAAWTADRSGRAVVEACGEDHRAVHLAAYTGDDVAALTPVGSNDESPDCAGTFDAGPRLELDVVAGRRYHVAVDDRYDFSASLVTLHVAPSNDNRADAADLPAPGTGADVDLTAAGTQAGEPRHAGVRVGGSAWYRITPAITGGLEVNTCATEPLDTVLATYRLESNDTLTPVAEGDDAAGCGSSGTGARVRWRAEAGHTYFVAVAGATAKRGPARIDVRTVAVAPPSTRLTAPVARRTSATSVAVAFDSDASDATFECRADVETTWTPCVSPVVRSDLSEGDHSVAVRATADGVTDADPAIAAFTVDRTAPEPILFTPSAGAVEPPPERFYDGTCSEHPGDLEQVTVRIWRGDTTAGTPAVTAVDPCDPYFESYAALDAGAYTIVVEQADDVGNTGTAAARHFTVQAAAPTMHLDRPGDATVTNARRPTFEGRTSGTGVDTVTVHVRAAAAAAAEPDVQTLSAAVVNGLFSVPASADLAEGAYRARAEGARAGGATGSSGDSAFVVDLTAPTVTIASPDGASTSDAAIAVSGGGENGAQVVVTAVGPDGVPTRRTADVTASAWSLSFPALAEGDTVITARQTDAAGNVGSSSPRTIHIDRTPPPPVLPPPPSPPATPPPAVPPPTPPPATPPATMPPPPPTPAAKTSPPASHAGAPTTSRSAAVATRAAAALADRLLPGSGSVALRQNDAFGNRLFVVPGSRLRLRAAGTQLVGVAICPLSCTLRIGAAIKLPGHGQKTVSTRPLTVHAGAKGGALRVVIDAALRRRIKRAGGARATVTISYVDARRGTHRASARLRLLPGGR